MSPDRLLHLLAGVLLTGYLTAALFFLRFWRQTNDRLFVYFALAFALLGAQRMALSLVGTSELETIPYYILRLIAYALILVAVVEKNRAARAPARDDGLR